MLQESVSASTNWPAIIGVTLAIVSAVVGASTAYLSLFIKNKLNEHKDEILDHIDKKFALKEIMEEKFGRVNERIHNLENRIHK